MRSALMILAATAAILVGTPVLAAGACAGDCDGDGSVTVNEVVRAVTVALGSAAVGQCSAADADGDGTVTIAELIGAVGAALGGCGGGATPTPVRTATPTPGVFVPGCDNGTFDVTYANVGAGNMVTSPLRLDLVAAAAGHAGMGVVIWGITGLQCTDGPTFHRAVQLQLIGAPGAFAPGTYAVKPPLGSFLYQEIQDNNVYLRAWDTLEATLTIEEAAGGRLRFRVSATMKPLPLFSFGQTPQGTFDLTVTGTVEHYTSQ